jgi:hypothetical protein
VLLPFQLLSTTSATGWWQSGAGFRACSIPKGALQNLNPETHLQRFVLRIIPLPHELGEQPWDHVAGHADDARGAVVVPRRVRLVIVAAP